MAEYIERADAVKTVLRGRKPENSVAQNRMLSIIQRDLVTMPAAAVAPVVRCKDCEFSHMDGWFCGGVGMMPEHTTLPESFCDHGRRKENNNEKV